MSLRFFVDHCVSNLVIASLRHQGHEVLKLGDYIPIESPDAAVIAQAQVLDSILVSLNGDFADIVSYPPQLYKGIISLQVRNHPETTGAISRDWSFISPLIRRWSTILANCCSSRPTAFASGSSSRTYPLPTPSVSAARRDAPPVPRA